MTEPIPMGGTTPARRVIKSWYFNYVYGANVPEAQAEGAADMISKYDARTQEILRELAEHTGIDISHIEVHTDALAQPAYWRLNHHRVKPAPLGSIDAGIITEGTITTAADRRVKPAPLATVDEHGRVNMPFSTAFKRIVDAADEAIAGAKDRRVGVTPKPYSDQDDLNEFKERLDTPDAQKIHTRLNRVLMGEVNPREADKTQDAQWEITRDLGAKLSIAVPSMFVDGIGTIQPPVLNVRFTPEEVEDLRLKVQASRLGRPNVPADPEMGLDSHHIMVKLKQSWQSEYSTLAGGAIDFHQAQGIVQQLIEKYPLGEVSITWAPRRAHHFPAPTEPDVTHISRDTGDGVLIDVLDEDPDITNDGTPA